MRILIVDDSKAMRMIVRRTLRKAGYGDHAFEEAADGAAAFDAVKNWNPDLVLSDWNMPEMNGIELLRAIRKDGTSVKFGFITSAGTTEMRETAAAEGALFVISKPFTADAIQDALTGVL